MTWFPPFDEPLLFAKVRAQVEEMADAMFVEVLADVVVPPEDEKLARELIQSRRGAVELAGLQAFDRHRRVHGDDIALDWRDHARQMMLVRLLEVFRPPEGGGGDGKGSGTNSPLGPLDGLRLPDPGGLPDESRSRLPLARQGVRYIATRRELAAVAGGMARGRTRRLLGRWTADSEAIADIEQQAESKATDRCERLWDPEQGSLLGYLSVCVDSVILEELRNLSRAKGRDAERSESLEHDEAERARQEASGDAVDPSAELLARGRTFLAWALTRLSPRQRREIERRLRDETPGTNADQTAWGRAVKALEHLYDEWIHLDESG